MNMAIKVALVEDDKRMRENLVKLIDSTRGFQCVGAYSDAESAVQRIRRCALDVVLMDLHLPRMSGIECVARLKAESPTLQVMMLTVEGDTDQIFQALAAGAVGYLLKVSSPDEITGAIFDLYRGGSPMSSQIARKAVQEFRKMRQPSTNLMEQLTRREQEILGHLSKGCRYKEIADLLSISENTVRNHLRKVYEKLHVHSRTEAVVKYLGR